MRISLFSGPGAGKSLIASRVFSELKTLGYSVELVQEYIKTWAYEGKKPKSFDQAYIFTKQLHAEDSPLQHVKHIVTDSPIFMQCVYALKYKFIGANHLFELARLFEECYPSVNIFLDRTGIEYQQWGRYENYEQAKEMDDHIMAMLDNELLRYRVIPAKDINGIISYIRQEIGDNK